MSLISVLFFVSFISEAYSLIVALKASSFKDRFYVYFCNH